MNNSTERRLNAVERIVRPNAHDDSDLESARWLLKLMLDWPVGMMLESRGKAPTSGKIDELKGLCRLARENLLHAGQELSFKQAIDTLPLQCVRGVEKFLRPKTEDNRT